MTRRRRAWYWCSTVAFNDQSEPLTILSAAAALPMPPTAYGVLPSWWSRDDGTVQELDLDLWGSATLSVTDGEIVAAIPKPFVYADNTIASVDHTADEFTETAHALRTGDGPLVLETDGVLPTGLAVGQEVWAIRTGANTFKLAASLAEALALTAIALSANGSGTMTLVDKATTKRVYWFSYGALPTPLSITVDRGFSTRALHRGEAVAYGLVGTVSAGTVSASITPVIEV